MAQLRRVAQLSTLRLTAAVAAVCALVILSPPAAGSIPPPVTGSIPPPLAGPRHRAIRAPSRGRLGLTGTRRAALNPIQAENRLPGTTGWRIPVGAGTVITGYSSELSLLPGQVAHLHVSAPAGDRYRVILYRLGWYHGKGGRLIGCLPGCRASRPAISQPPTTPPDPVSGLFRAPWRVTAKLVIPPWAVSGYYEAKLNVVHGPDRGAVGSIPLIVRAPATAPASAILVQVPVNTWEAYNPWGGKSLYGSGETHATEVSFDRPFDQTEFRNMQSDLELPWVQFLEREGYDVAYQTDLDTSLHPRSLLHHRLVFSIGHDEYWTQLMRDAFDRALARATNLMFGANSGLWRMRYDSRYRTEVEWRNPAADPIQDRRRDTGYFRTFNEPECRLMAVQYEYYGQRGLTAPPSPYTVVGPADDPWLGRGGLLAGDVVPGVVGYEWDSLVPGCFQGSVVPLMHADPWGPGGPVSADMVRATAPSGARVFAMGTLELPFVLNGSDPNVKIVSFVRAALSDLTRPAPPASLTFRRVRHHLIVRAHLAAPDPRVQRVAVKSLSGAGGCSNALRGGCRLKLERHPSRYAAVAIDPWGRSLPLVVSRA